MKQGGDAHIVFNDDWALVDSTRGHGVWPVLELLYRHLEFLGEGFDVIGAVLTPWD